MIASTLVLFRYTSDYFAITGWGYALGFLLVWQISDAMKARK